MCNHRRECHCEPGWAAPYCEQEISGIAAGRVPSPQACPQEEGARGGAGTGREVPLRPQAPALVPAGSGSAVLAAVLAVLALAGLGMGSGVVLLRARAARRSHKG